MTIHLPQPSECWDCKSVTCLLAIKFLYVRRFCRAYTAILLYQTSFHKPMQFECAKWLTLRHIQLSFRPGKPSNRTDSSRFPREPGRHRQLLESDNSLKTQPSESGVTQAMNTCGSKLVSLTGLGVWVTEEKGPFLGSKLWDVDR